MPAAGASGRVQIAIHDGITGQSRQFTIHNSQFHVPATFTLREFQLTGPDHLEYRALVPGGIGVLSEGRATPSAATLSTRSVNDRNQQVGDRTRRSEVADEIANLAVVMLAHQPAAIHALVELAAPRPAAPRTYRRQPLDHRAAAISGSGRPHARQWRIEKPGVADPQPGPATYFGGRIVLGREVAGPRSAPAARSRTAGTGRLPLVNLLVTHGSCW
jgi:hypothetical protein